MRYTNIRKATFLSRPNRFIAHCILNGEQVIAHVKNTGRCRELLVEGATVYLDEPTGRERKTKYDLIAVEKHCEDGRVLLINMDSGAPNEAAAEFLINGRLFPDATIRREVTKGNSRFDFCIKQGEKTTFLEVKGVTLENDGVVRFPDAPTLRGIKHLKELQKAITEGYRTCVVFLIQMDNVKYFEPNYDTHPEFAKALEEARSNGVEIYAFDSVVTPYEIQMNKKVKIRT